MLSVVFRTAAGEQQGLGHLVRCSHLARSLQARGHQVQLLVDHCDDRLAPFCAGLAVEPLYETAPAALDPAEDAARVKERLMGWAADWLVVDDYRLATDWEQRLAGDSTQIAVLDDLQREHHCDLLIDMRWRGEDTNSAYQGLVPAGATCLLGPRYALLDPRHRWQRSRRQPSASFQVLVGLGGGGNAEQLAAIAEALLNVATDYPKPLELVLVCGPLTTAAACMETLQQRHPALRILQAPPDLVPELERTDLYVGAAGGVLYQLLALGIPAFTFSLSDNQDNDTATEAASLEEIGHLFHAGRWQSSLLKGLPAFVRTVMEQPQRIQALATEAPMPVDGRGCARVVAALERCRREALSPRLSLRAVRDSDLNHYLLSRNLAANRRNMLSSEPIPATDHYGWWFTAKRESFLVMRDGEPCLYIWHEPRSTAAGPVLIGGWFVCQNEPLGFDIPLLSLRWQLQRCDVQYPTLPWMAVIHRDNAFVKLLNQHCGFQAAAAGSAAETAIRACFPQAAPDLFEAVWRPAASGGGSW